MRDAVFSGSFARIALSMSLNPTGEDNRFAFGIFSILGLLVYSLISMERKAPVLP
jgi:hypothetical protein